jgi:hypothetical protein
MSTEQRKRISSDLKTIARDLSHRHIIEDKNVNKLLDLAKELVEDQPKEGTKTLIED